MHLLTDDNPYIVFNVALYHLIENNLIESDCQLIRHQSTSTKTVKCKSFSLKKFYLIKRFSFFGQFDDVGFRSSCRSPRIRVIGQKLVKMTFVNKIHELLVSNKKTKTVNPRMLSHGLTRVTPWLSVL
jgi:hypothetical protein